MFTELFPYCLSISVGQMSSDNGLPHVSLKVSIEDTKHEGLFNLKKLLFFRFTTWSTVGVQDLIIIMESGPPVANNELGPTLPSPPGGCSRVPFSASASVTPVCSSSFH